MFQLIKKCNVLIVGNARGLGTFVEYAREKNKIIIQIMDVSSFDHMNFEPNIFCTISDKFKDAFLKNFDYQDLELKTIILLLSSQRAS